MSVESDKFEDLVAKEQTVKPDESKGEFVINILQFCQPNGRKRNLQLIADPRMDRQKYKEMLKHGCRLTVEKLNTGHYSHCIEHPDGDFNMRITSFT